MLGCVTFFFIRGPSPQNYLPQSRNLSRVKDPCELLLSLTIACNIASLPGSCVGTEPFSKDTTVQCEIFVGSKFRSVADSCV